MSNQLLKKLFEIMIEKKSNLCVAADFDNIDDLFNFIDECGKHICILKTHIRKLRQGFSPEVGENLLMKKKEHNFLLLEDGKWIDHEETVYGLYSFIVPYFDLVTIAPIYGIEIFDAIERAAITVDEPRGCLAVTDVSFARSCQIDPKVEMEKALLKPVCVGMISQKLQVPRDQRIFIKVSPGVHIDQSTDNRNQNWRHPTKVIEDGADIVIVGRGITAAPPGEREASTIKYKEISWKAYCENIRPQLRYWVKQELGCEI